MPSWRRCADSTADRAARAAQLETQTAELRAELSAAREAAQAHEGSSRLVRGHIESQAQAGRVPVGSPARSGPDPSTLSADEKIRIGLEQRARS